MAVVAGMRSGRTALRGLNLSEIRLTKQQCSWHGQDVRCCSPVCDLLCRMLVSHFPACLANSSPRCRKLLLPHRQHPIPCLPASSDCSIRAHLVSLASAAAPLPPLAVPQASPPLLLRFSPSMRSYVSLPPVVPWPFLFCYPFCRQSSEAEPCWECALHNGVGGIAEAQINTSI